MPAAILVHGLAGCAEANYVVRVSRRLLRLGIRVVRVNLRGAGEGFGLARRIYHAGRSDDLREVVRVAAPPDRRLSHRPGRLLAGGQPRIEGRHRSGRCARSQGSTACWRPIAPIDLVHCAQLMRRPENRVYDWNFVRWLRGMVDRLHRRFPELGPPAWRECKTLLRFRRPVHGPRGGFASADDYYSRCSLRDRAGAHRSCRA